MDIEEISFLEGLGGLNEAAASSHRESLGPTGLGAEPDRGLKACQHGHPKMYSIDPISRSYNAI